MCCGTSGIPTTGLFRRFSLGNKPSLVGFDLYDNAEAINLAVLMDDRELADAVAAAIEKWFGHGRQYLSQIDCLGLRHNRNTLRWAVMPCLYALSALESLSYTMCGLIGTVNIASLPLRGGAAGSSRAGRGGADEPRLRRSQDLARSSAPVHRRAVGKRRRSRWRDPGRHARS